MHNGGTSAHRCDTVTYLWICLLVFLWSPNCHGKFTFLFLSFNDVVFQLVAECTYFYSKCRRTITTLHSIPIVDAVIGHWTHRLKVWNRKKKRIRKRKMLFISLMWFISGILFVCVCLYWQCSNGDHCSVVVYMFCPLFIVFVRSQAIPTIFQIHMCSIVIRSSLLIFFAKNKNFEKKLMTTNWSWYRTENFTVIIVVPTRCSQCHNACAHSHTYCCVVRHCHR